MKDERLRQLLAGRYVATLGTWNEDGTMYLNAVWYLERDGRILIGTAGTTRKARNAARRPEGAVMIDTRGPGDQRGAAAAGSFEIVSGAEARGLNELIAQKYLTQAGLDHPDVGGSIRTNDDVTIRFTPTRWTTWGTDSDFDDAYGKPGICLPLDE